MWVAVAVGTGACLNANVEAEGDTSELAAVRSSLTTTAFSYDVPHYENEVQNDIVLRYLRGTASLEELASELTIPPYQLMSLAEILEKVVELRSGHSRVLGEGQEAPDVASKTDGVHRLSVEGLSRFFSAQGAGTSWGEIYRFGPGYYLPTWFYYEHRLFNYRVRSPIAEYEEFLYDLSSATREFIAGTRLQELRTIQTLVFPRLWCLQSINIELGGLLSALIRDVDSRRLSLSWDFAGHPEVRLRAEEAGLSREVVAGTLSDCANSNRYPIYELAYDFDGAYDWLYDQVLSFLLKWLSENEDRRPRTLIFEG